jgi:hypothetical protein
MVTHFGQTFQNIEHSRNIRAFKQHGPSRLFGCPTDSLNAAGIVKHYLEQTGSFCYDGGNSSLAERGSHATPKAER